MVIVDTHYMGAIVSNLRCGPESNYKETKPLIREVELA